MSNDMRPVGIGFGVVLGLVLAAPWLSPSVLRWGIEALFLLSAFLVRLADRRWNRREGLSGWTSHMRMMPARLLPWGAVAVVAFIAESPGVSASRVIAAAAISELLVYPMLAGAIGRAKPHNLIGAILILTSIMALVGGDILRCVGAFAIGATLCACWLRGPDGEPRYFALALGGTGLFSATGWALPVTQNWSAIAAIACATLALAQLSTLRPRVMHWRPQGPIRFRRRSTPPGLPPF